MRCVLVLCALVAMAAAIESETLAPSADKQKDIPTNQYQFKYGLGEGEKALLDSVSYDSDDLNKAFFEYTNSRDQVYRTDYIADAAHPDHIL